MQVAANLCLYSSLPNADERNLTDATISKFCELQINLSKFSSVAPSNFFGTGPSDKWHLTTLRGLIDAAAFNAELVRQGNCIVQQVASVWVDDYQRVASVIRSWLPVEWDNDQELLQATPESKDKQRKLLTNPHFPSIGDAIDALAEGSRRVSRLNIVGFDKIVKDFA